MERESTGYLIDDKKLEKLAKLTCTIFDLLWTNFHNASEHHLKFSEIAIADAIYKMGPILKTGKISEEAQRAIDEGKIVRAQLCEEHPKTRRATAKLVINTFNDLTILGCSNTVVRGEMSEILQEGCMVNLVLSEENRKLVPFQAAGLAPSKCYELAGINLIDDKGAKQERTYYYQGQTYSTQPEIARDWNISTTTVRRLIKKGKITVERKEV